MHSDGDFRARMRALYFRSPKARAKRPADSDRQIAALAAALRKLPGWAIAAIGPRALVKSLGLTISKDTVGVVVEQYRKSMEVNMAGTGEEITGEEIGSQALLEDLAKIASKTYAYKGDDEEIASEDALTLMVRLMNMHSPSLLSRNAKRRAPAPKPPQRTPFE